MNVMKRIVVIAVFTAVALVNAYARQKSPVSDPKNNIYVGSADVSNPLNMYNEAVIAAFYEFYKTCQGAEEQPSDTVKGFCDIRLLKSEIVEDSVFFVWLEILPWEGHYEYEMSSDITGTKETVTDGSSGEELSVEETMYTLFHLTLTDSYRDSVKWQSTRSIHSHIDRSSSDVNEYYNIETNTLVHSDISVRLSSER